MSTPAAHTNRDVAIASIPVNLIEQCLAHQKVDLDSAHTIGARVFFLRDPPSLVCCVRAYEYKSCTYLPGALYQRRMDHTRANMSTMNRFLSRKDKHRHGTSKENVMSSPTSKPSSASTSIHASSTRSRQSSGSSLSSVSLAFPDLRAKRSPRLQATDGTVECSSTDRGTYLLQPKSNGGPFNGLFVTDGEKKSIQKDEEKKIKQILHRLGRAGITTFKEQDVSYVLNAAYASGNTDKAYELIVLLNDSEEGIIQSYDPNIKLLGAINREGVTCYLDGLLFAMFARLGSFEAMLYKNFEDPPRKRLATLLRLWVNTLRAGKLITTDITKQIQLQLANCGWKEAAEVCQQDASEAFTFITSTLALPLLTLKMDIFHTGKEDVSDDHKFVNERLLELAIPDTPEDGHVITLEECLELYFNNKIEVKRYLDLLERRNTLNSVRSRGSVDSAKAHTSHVEVADLGDASASSSPTSVHMQSELPVRPPFLRHRAPSIIQENYVPEKRGTADGYPAIDDGSPSTGRVRKEVMMPAWQFFSLIPWYTNNMPVNDAQVAAHFSSTRPILGICLKRYSMLPNGRAVKRQTHIDIPLEIGLPHFIQDDKMSENGPAFGNFKISLQSVVCHRGVSTESGHYISLVRNPDPNGEGEDRWMRFDDLASERVIDADADKFLHEESPYLLFYQVIPIEGETGSVTDGDVAIKEGERPPAYSESNASGESKVDSGVGGVSVEGRDSYASTEDSRAGTQRPSLELSRPSTDPSTTSEDRRGRTSMTSERRGSVVFSDTPASSPTRAKTEYLTAPVLDHSQTDGIGRPTASRRGSKTTKASSKSRPSSRSDDKRISTSISRLASRLSKDKLDKPVVPPSQAGSKESLDRPSLQVKDLPEGTTGPPAALVAETEKPSDRARLKKEAKEKFRTAHREHQHLSKARRKENKPDRECSVM